MAAKRTANRPAVRGIMLDSARLMEKHSFYFDLLPRLARWGFNTLWWHFCDDQGFGVKLDSHPEIVTPFAFSKPEVRRFVKAAAEVGIDVVPEIETLGHASYITRLPQYAHLADGDRMHFNAACPSQKQTLDLMADILAEIAGLFPSPYLHAGLDEVNFAGCKRCAARGRGKPKWWVYAEHTKAIHKIITSLGKRMIMWADHVEAAPAMLRRLPKDIVMAHWQYRDVEQDKIRRSLDAGFEAIGAPSMAWFGDMILTPTRDYDVMDKMAATAAKLRRKGMLGMVNTWWVPGRFLRDACSPTVAYTGAILGAGGGVDRLGFMRKHARREFGLVDAAATRAIWRLHELPIHMFELQSLCLESTADRFDAIAIARADGFADRLAAVEQCAAALLAGRKKAKRNKPEYDTLILAALMSSTLLNNAKRMADVHEITLRAQRSRNAGAAPSAVAAMLAPAVEALQSIVAAMDDLVPLVAREWNRTRYAADAKKHLADAATSPCGRHMLLGRLARGRLAAKAMLNGFTRGVTACKRGAAVPRWG